MTATKLRGMIDQLVVKADLSGYTSDIYSIISFSDGKIIGKCRAYKNNVVFNSHTRTWNVQ